MVKPSSDPFVEFVEKRLEPGAIRVVVMVIEGLPGMKSESLEAMNRPSVSAPLPTA